MKTVNTLELLKRNLNTGVGKNMDGRLNLTSLKLQNFATFTNQNIQFTNNLNTIVGETGSGKSLILDALQLSFGARADKKLVRKGAEFATIETSFSCVDDKASEFFDKIGFPYEDEIVIKRIIYSSGKSKSYLNFQSCPLNVLTRVARKFIDLVGQFENQKLLSAEYQLKLLDNYANNSELFLVYTAEFEKLKSLESRLIDLNENKLKSIERKEFLLFQINELSQLEPSTEDEKLLRTKKDQILNFEENKKTFENINQLLSEDEYSALNTLSRAEREIANLKDDSLLERIANLKSELEDISFEVSKASDNEEPEDNIDEIIDRLDTYQRLKRKFNTDTEGLVSTLNKYQDEYDQIEVIDSDINKLHLEISQLSQKCLTIANDLHATRVKEAKNLSEALTTLIRKLKMEGAIIDIRISKRESLSLTGLSDLSFFAQTNPGEGFHPIKDIASGGELSRILLSLRQVLSQSGSISVFLFDEIDTGVGGETAVAIGKALEEVSKGSQVIAITHLPQIANFANQIINVSKETINDESGDRTISKVEHLTGNKANSFVKSMQVL